MFCHAVVRRIMPHFSIPPESVYEVMPGGSVNLTCIAIGSPMPHVKWRLGATDLTPDASVPIGRNILVLTDIKESATYTCVAVSDLGKVEARTEVKVKGKVVFLQSMELWEYIAKIAIWPRVLMFVIFHTFIFRCFLLKIDN